MSDWLKVYHGLSRRREVVQIAGETGRSRQEVVGFLLEFWEWVDCEASDGKVRGASFEQLPELVGGDEILWKSVRKSGWIRSGKGWISAPNWDLRNSGSRKMRYQARLRKRKQRSGHADVTVTSTGHERECHGTQNQTKMMEMGEMDGWSGALASSSMKDKEQGAFRGAEFFKKTREVVERVCREAGMVPSLSDVHNGLAVAFAIRREGKASNLWGMLTERLRRGWRRYKSEDDEAARRLYRAAAENGGGDA